MQRACRPSPDSTSTFASPTCRPCRSRAPADQRRMEAGILNYGNDITIEDNPFQVSGLERLVECLDGDVDHIGKEALRRIRDQGVTRKLVGLEIGGAPLSMWLEDFWPVRP